MMVVSILQVVKRMQEVCLKEGLKVNDVTMSALVEVRGECKEREREGWGGVI